MKSMGTSIQGLSNHKALQVIIDNDSTFWPVQIQICLHDIADYCHTKITKDDFDEAYNQAIERIKDCNC